MQPVAFPADEPPEQEASGGAGDEQVDLEEWCRFLAERCGLNVEFDVTDATIGGVTVSVERMHALCGPAQVRWRDGFGRLADAWLAGQS